MNTADKNELRKIYSEVDVPVKKLMELYHGKETFSQKITDRVKTFKDALELVELSENEKMLLAYNGKETQMISTQAHIKLSIIAKVLNEGWAPDWTNGNEAKYYPCLKYTSGVGFSCHAYDNGRTSTSLGSRLCFKSKELAEYAAKQFQDIYNDFLN